MPSDSFRTRLKTLATMRKGVKEAIIEDYGLASTIFEQVGEGAVERTLETKVQEAVSVKDFGALGDEETNDTAAFQAAVDAVALAGGGQVYAPPGTYIINPTGATPLQMKSNVRLTGAGRRATILRMPANGSGFTFKSVIRFGDDSTDATFRNVTIEHIGFDMWNWGKTTAVLTRRPVIGLWIDNCDAFCSQIDDGVEPLDPGGDNYLLNQASLVGEETTDIPGNIWVTQCRVSQQVQICASSGVSGFNGLFIIGNYSYKANSYAIAVTSSGIDYQWKNIIIAQNILDQPWSAGIYVTPDANTENAYEAHLVEGAIGSMENVIIADNEIFVGGDHTQTGSVGVTVRPAYSFNTNIQVSNNRILGDVDSTDISALRIESYDFNFASVMHEAAPIIEAADINTTTNVITYADHKLLTGATVLFTKHAAEDTMPGGIVQGNRYRVLRVDDDSFSLVQADTATWLVVKEYLLNEGAAPTLIDITTQGVGSFDLRMYPSFSQIVVSNPTSTYVDRHIDLVSANNLTIQEGSSGRVVIAGYGENISFNGVTFTSLVQISGEQKRLSICNCQWRVDDSSQNASTRLLRIDPGVATLNCEVNADNNRCLVYTPTGVAVSKVTRWFSSPAVTGTVSLAGSNNHSKGLSFPYDDVISKVGVTLTWWMNNTIEGATAAAGLSRSFGSQLVQGNTAIPAGGTAGAGYLFSATTNFGVFFGSGAPSLSAAKGSLYLRSDGDGTGNRLYVNSNGTTGWIAITTAT